MGEAIIARLRIEFDVVQRKRTKRHRPRRQIGCAETPLSAIVIKCRRPRNAASRMKHSRSRCESSTIDICDSIDKYGYDGFDIDYEPNYGSPGNLASYPENMLTFVKALGERIGPKSDTGRLLVIDGEPQSIHPETGPYFDYFIVQAYSNLAGNSDANLDRRLAGTIANFKGILPPEKVANMYIVTENFESYAPTGGGDYVDRYGNKMRALAGMARWTPTIDGKQVRKGGVGTYHMEYDYPGDIEYKYLREAIRIMNPAVK